MRDTLHKSPETGPYVASSMGDLIYSMSRHLILVTGGTYVVCFYAVIARWPETLDWGAGLVTISMIVTCSLSLVLLGKWTSVGVVTWLVGLAMTITLAFIEFQQPEILFLFALLPLLTCITMGNLAGILMEGLSIALTIILSNSPLVQPPPSRYVSQIIALGLLTGLMGWVVNDTLLSAIQWFGSSLALAENNLVETRHHRAQLSRVKKSLEIAYRGLEKANSELAAAWQAANEAEHLKTQLVTTVSHELRTPLNLIIGFAEMMRTSPESYDSVALPGPYRCDVNAIYHSAQHLLALVDDVIDLARVESGKITLAREKVDIASLVSEVTGMLGDFIAAKGLELRIHVDAGLPLLWMDRLRIRQVLLNLLTNAIRFTEQGQIGVDVEQHGNEVLVRVTDTGKGILERDLPTVFEEYAHSEATSTTWHSGSGLGLPISKKFIELHSGRIGVESTYTKGSTFWFTLPCLPQAAVGRQPLPAGLRVPTEGPPFSARSIVLVHDDPQAGHLLEHHLDGYRVTYTDGIKEGIAMAEDSRGILLVTDPAKVPSSLPDGTLIVNCPLPSGPQAAASLGADDLLMKPVSRQAMLTAIERLARPVRRVLIADDEPEAIRLFRRMLHTRIPDQHLLAAHTSEEALRLVKAEKPDLMLLDLVLPEAGGLHVLEQMTADPDLADIAVIIVSAKAEDHMNLALSGPIQISRSNNFQVGEIMEVLEAIFNVLAPKRILV